MKKLIIGAFSLLAVLLPLSAQQAAPAGKKPVDLEACTLWKRVDNPSVSPTGRWVTYRISPMEYDPDNKEAKILHLFDPQTGKRLQLEDVGYSLAFYNNDRNAFYQQADTTGQEHTYIVSLPSGKITEWTYGEALCPVEGTPYSISVTRVPEDTVAHVPAFDRLVVRHLDTGKAFHIDHVSRYVLYNKQRSIVFIRAKEGKREICYGPLKGPYKTLYTSPVKDSPSSFGFDARTLEGEFTVSDSLWYGFSLKKPSCSQLFDVRDIPVPEGLHIARISLSRSRSFATLELAPGDASRRASRDRKKPERDKSFELELWTWDEYEVPTLQRDYSYVSVNYPRYIYDLHTGKLTQVAPADAELLTPEDAGHVRYVLYTDETPYRSSKEWLEGMPFDVYAVCVSTGAKTLIGKTYRDRPKWSPDGRYALMYDPLARCWKKFDGATGVLAEVDGIPYPVHFSGHDKPLPAPACGLAGWTADGRYAFICDDFDWWKVDLAGKDQPVCFTKGYGRKRGKVIRKATSNIDKEVFEADEEIIVSLFDVNTSDEGLYSLSMSGRLKKLVEGPYKYTVHAFSDNRKYCIWNRQNVSTFRDLWWSKADFTDAVRVTDVNPQQKDYRWAQARLVKWTNYANQENKGILYLPEDYDPQKTYPVLVQFYETYSEELNVYRAPMYSPAMGDIMMYVSNGYIVFLPDVYFKVGVPYQSSYDCVVSGVNHLIKEGIAKPGKIGLQGHSWSGYQAGYLVAHTDTLFKCANIGAPITDMVSGYLGIRGGSGLPRYFMYEEWQSRMGASLWEARKNYLDASVLLEADKIRIPLLIFHNDNDEAVAYEQGRALYLAMRRLRRPAWLLNYKGEGHFLGSPAAQRDWTIRQMQFFDYYLKGTGEPRWMKEGIHVRERGIDQKYDLVK